MDTVLSDSPPGRSTEIQGDIGFEDEDSQLAGHPAAAGLEQWIERIMGIGAGVSEGRPCDP